MNEPTTEKNYELSSVELAETATVGAYELEELANEVMEYLSEDTDAAKCRRLEVVTENGNFEARIYEDYVGRGFGRKCVGIVTDKPLAVVELAAQYGITGAKMDSMGLDTIVYWDRIKWVPEG